MKEEEWSGYYDGYRRRAAERGVTAVELLDEEWWNGRHTAENCVWPYVTSDSAVLEIAAGIGRVSRFVAPRCKRLVCTDILDDALIEARKNLGDFDNVEFQKTNGYDLAEFAPSTFDCVYSFTAFFHFSFELVVAYFAEIKRVLKPEGTAIVEFKRWKDRRDIVQLLDKIERAGGLRSYEKNLSKWHYVSNEMLDIVCKYYDLLVVDPNLTRFTFRRSP